MIKMSLVFLFFFFSFGCLLSIKEISYTKNDKVRLTNLIQEADFYIKKSYDPFSDLSFNGSFEYNLTKEKKCSPEKLINRDRYKILVYSHRFPFVGKKNQLKAFFTNNQGCFTKDNSFSILRTEINLKPNNEFIKKGNDFLNSINISKDAKIICLIVRDNEYLKMSLKDSVSPVLIEDQSDKNSFFVIMPMKI